MKTKTFLMLLFVVSLVTCHLSLAFAAPQRIQIQTDAKKQQKAAAKSRINALRLADIEDPAARKAITEILNYLQTNK